jgi:hypothetical protein
VVNLLMNKDKTAIMNKIINTNEILIFLLIFKL